jgi:hypothetical protein
VLEVLYSRRRELGFFGELRDADPHPEVRRFFEEVVRKALDQDIRVRLAAARGRERSERGRAELTRAMRELLQEPKAVPIPPRSWRGQEQFRSVAPAPRSGLATLLAHSHRRAPLLWPKRG